MAAQWLQVYKKKNKSNSWMQFVLAVEQKYGKDNYRKAVTDLLELQQSGTVEDYYQQFQTLQFEICKFTTYQFADIFTKGLPSSTFSEFRSSLNVAGG